MAKEVVPVMVLSPLGWLVVALWLGLGACVSPPEETGSDTLSEPSNATSLPDSSIRALDPPAAEGAMAPRLAPGPDDTAILSWLEPLADENGEPAGHRLRVATLDGDTWSEATTVAESDELFANWADTPGVAVFHADPSADGADAIEAALIAAWPERLGEGTYAYGLSLATSQGADGSFRRIGLLHDDDTPEEHGFVSFVPAESGGVRAFWLDGRELDSNGGAHGVPRGAMQLRTGVVGAQRLAANEPGTSTILDPRVCECCSTDAAIAAGGPVVAYRDRDENEVRDIFVVRATADGWSEPVRVHADGWRIEGCPVNGPAIGADAETIVVAWFTAAASEPRVRAAWSSDGGASFGEPIEIDGGPLGESSPLGRVDLALDARGDAWVTWIGLGEEGPAIRLRQIGRDGTAGPVRSVATTTERRASGVPHLLAQGDRLLVAWVADENPSTLRVATVPLS